MMNTSVPVSSLSRARRTACAPSPRVDVAPQVPLPGVRVEIVGGELLVVLRLHHVGEAQPDHLQLRIPPAQLHRHPLLERLYQRVRGVRPRRVLLVHRDVGRRHIEREPQHRLAGRPDDVADARPAGPADDIPGRRHVVDERLVVRHPARGRDGGQVHHRVNGVVMLLHPEHGVQHLPVVGEINREIGDSVGGGRRRRSVEHRHVPAVLDELPDARPAELAGSSCHHDLCHCATSASAFRRESRRVPQPP